MKLVIAGVSGCGKSVIGREVAKLTGADFLDADDFHSPEAVAKMASGQALTDEDRAGWLDKLGECLASRDGSVVLACSALKGVYRDRLRERCPELAFVLLKADPAVIRMRIEERSEEGHFMPASLLDSQLATLEEGADLKVVENRGSIEEVARRVVADL